MSEYIVLRFKGVVKRIYREEFKTIIITRMWELGKYEKFRAFSNIKGSSLIFTNSSVNVPEHWQDILGVPTDGFERYYDVKTGSWSFQCSLSNDESIFESFLKLVPYFIKCVEHCEVYDQGTGYYQEYKLINQNMITIPSV